MVATDHCYIGKWSLLVATAIRYSIIPNRERKELEMNQTQATYLGVGITILIIVIYYVIQQKSPTVAKAMDTYGQLLREEEKDGKKLNPFEKIFAKITRKNSPGKVVKAQNKAIKTVGMTPNQVKSKGFMSAKKGQPAFLKNNPKWEKVFINKHPLGGKIGRGK